MELSAHRYVAITTYRRNGEAVSVPVWIAPLADGRVGFSTPGGSGKVKRIRNNPSVEVVPCDVRGNVAAGTAPTQATAEVVSDGPVFAEVRAAIGDKYGLQYKLINLWEASKAKLGGRSRDVVAVVLTLE